MRDEDRERRPSLAFWATVLLLIAVIYVLSSGPVIASGFWLREATGRDEFYVVIFVYYPLLAFGHQNPIGDYIEWWVNLFDTVGPG